MLKKYSVLVSTKSHEICHWVARLVEGKAEQTPHRATERHLSYGISQWYLPPDRGECAPPLNLSQIGWYSIYLPRRDGRLSWPRQLVTYRDVLPACRQSTIAVLTKPGVQ